MTDAIADLMALSTDSQDASLTFGDAEDSCCPVKLSECVIPTSQLNEMAAQPGETPDKPSEEWEVIIDRGWKADTTPGARVHGLVTPTIPPPFELSTPVHPIPWDASQRSPEPFSVYEAQSEILIEAIPSQDDPSSPFEYKAEGNVTEEVSEEDRVRRIVVTSVKRDSLHEQAADEISDEELFSQLTQPEESQIEPPQSTREFWSDRESIPIPVTPVQRMKVLKVKPLSPWMNAALRRQDEGTPKKRQRSPDPIGSEGEFEESLLICLSDEELPVGKLDVVGHLEGMEVDLEELDKVEAESRFQDAQRPEGANEQNESDEIVAKDPTSLERSNQSEDMEDKEPGSDLKTMIEEKRRAQCPWSFYRNGPRVEPNYAGWVTSIAQYLPDL